MREETREVLGMAAKEPQLQLIIRRGLLDCVKELESNPSASIRKAVDLLFPVLKDRELVAGRLRKEFEGFAFFVEMLESGELPEGVTKGIDTQAIIDFQKAVIENINKYGAGEDDF